MTTGNDSQTRIVLSWLREDAHENAERVLLRALDEVDATPQRRSLWLARRFSEMSNYARLAAVVATAVILLAAMALLLGAGLGPNASDAPSSPSAPPGTPSGSSASATAAALLPGEFTACVPGNTAFKTGTDVRGVVGDQTIERRRGFTWKGTITATDPRFTGTHYYSWDGSSYTLASGDDGQVAWAEGHRIENDKGAWQGGTVGVTLPGGTSAGGLAVLTGEGAYAGLTAVLFGTDGPCFLNWRGMVTEVPDPPVPYTGG